MHYELTMFLQGIFVRYFLAGPRGRPGRTNGEVSGFDHGEYPEAVRVLRAEDASHGGGTGRRRVGSRS